MPTEENRRYYARGFADGMKFAVLQKEEFSFKRQMDLPFLKGESKPKRKLSAWQKYIKNKRNHIKYRDGKLNLKKMGVEFRRKKRR
jgi:hypothetical protein